MKINFNRDNITKYLIIGGVTILTLVTGYKFSSDGNKITKFNTPKNNKQVEENNTMYDVTGYGDEYHLEGTDAIKNTPVPTTNDEFILPDGYTLENRDGKLYAVKRVTSVISADKVYDENGDTFYSVANYPGYNLVGDKGVKTLVEEYLVEEKTKSK